MDPTAVAATTHELAEVLAWMSPDEAPFAAHYVTAPPDRSTEAAIGFPGGGTAKLVGPWALGVLTDTARNVLQAAGVTDPVPWLARVGRTAPSKAPPRSPNGLVAELVSAGWPEDDAKVAAEELLRRGERLALGVNAPSPAAPGGPADQVFPMSRLAGLRDALADLYGTSDAAMLVAEDLGLDVARIARHPEAQLQWRAILDEARKQGKVGALVRRAREDYGDNPGLGACASELGLA